jgi:triosephosphate isomerase
VALITLKMFKQRTVFCFRACIAIGIGNFVQPEEANEMHGMIRKIIAEKTLPKQNTLKLLTMEV